MGEMMSMREAYGHALVELGDSNPDVMVIDADVSNSDYSYLFHDAFPNRFFDVGISEQALVDVAVGMANGGYIPFANTFAAFFASRALEMVRTHMCYGRANVKLMAINAGLSSAFDGPTHHCLTDLSIMRSLPRMTVIAPADNYTLVKLLPAVAEHLGPVYFRINRSAVPAVYQDDFEPFIGRAHQLRGGTDVTIIACGMMVSMAVEAVRRLESSGISAGILDMHTIKPLDRDAVIRAAQETGAIVAAEEHSVVGGLGAAVAEVISEEFPVPLRRVGTNDRFAETGPYETLLEGYGLTPDAIVEAAKSALKAKG